MNRNLSLKLGAIAFLIVLLLVPLLMIGGLIQERQSLRDGVVQDIAQSSSFSQTLSGPLLVVPYRKIERQWKTPEGGGALYQDVKTVNGHLYFLPETFDLNARIDTELRSRGIYEARLYHAENRINGQFQIPVRLGLGNDFEDYTFDAPFLAVAISDIRGIEKGLKLDLNGQSMDFQPGTGLSWLGAGVHVALPALDSRNETVLDYAFDVSLQGTGKLQVLPVGRSSNVTMAANWPHPSFVGNYLPSSRLIDSQSFTANWKTSFFSTNMEDALSQCVNNESCLEFKERAFGVSFIDPVDQYLKSERAIKYALLFIALTFAGFFLFEVLKSLSVHPIQYLLVGVALAFFYLLLLSLSEHVGFGPAYAISASACVLLIGFYLSHVLHSLGRALSFSGGLAVLYGMLYGLLSAEDYALLMGSLLLFGLLGVFMILTRRLDWYRVGQGKLQ